MRRLLLALPVVPLLAACPSTAPAPDTGDDAGDGGGLADGNPFDGPIITPQTEACTGDATACLSGTAAPSGFTAKPKRMEVNLYGEYPASNATPLTTVPVAVDGTWAFSGLSSWPHYFVQVVADFGQPVAIASVVGSLAVPSTGAPVPVRVLPVQLSILQEAQTGGAQQLVSALAYVFDPSTGAAVSDASVAIVVGGTPQPMTWTTVAASTSAYVLKAPSGTAAQASYAVTTALPGSATSTWQLTSPTSTLTPALTAPANGATVAKGAPFTVTWSAVPADAESVELYAMAQGAWTSVYQSPLDAADVTQQAVPGMNVTAGPLLVNVQFLLGGCPASSDGCVAAAVVAATQVTAQ